MKLSHNYYVYIVECHDGSYYTGITNNLERRPVELKYYEHFNNVNAAIAWEKQIKGWSRKKKQALFEENWDKIKELAKSKSNKTESKP